MIEQDPLIAEYSHERSRPREAEALLMLRKVASMVKPIMRQRGWRVGVLTEFYPPETNLLGLNWNKGQKICLRLRYPGDERQFLPFENVVDTMLHELAHIVHGPHNAAFHALWDQLRDEHEVLLRKGYTGEGFLSTGHKLGGSSRIPMHEARRRARAAAEQRRVLSAGSGQKLGGALLSRGADIRQVIADAAQRRINVTQGCAGVEDTQRRSEIVEETARNGFRTKAEEDDANDRAIMDAYIELIQEEERERFGSDYVPPSQADPLGSQGRRKAAEEQAQLELQAARGPVPTTSDKPNKSSRSSKPSDSKGKTGSSASPLAGAAAVPPPLSPPKTTTTTPAAPPLQPTAAISQSETWTCDICTLHNPPTFLICDACGTERPTWGPDPSMPPPALPTAVRGSHAARPPAAAAGTAPVSSTAIDRAIRRRRSRDTLGKLAELSAAEQSRPLGWVCRRCGTFMETEWWTCAGCGAVKERS